MGVKRRWLAAQSRGADFCLEVIQPLWTQLIVDCWLLIWIQPSVETTNNDNGLLEFDARPRQPDPNARISDLDSNFLQRSLSTSFVISRRERISKSPFQQVCFSFMHSSPISLVSVLIRNKLIHLLFHQRMSAAWGKRWWSKMIDWFIRQKDPPNSEIPKRRRQLRQEILKSFHG